MRRGEDVREIKKNKKKNQRGHIGRSGENRRKEEGSLGAAKGTESCAGIRKEML